MSVGKRLAVGVVIVAALLMGLGVTTLALSTATERISGNIFSTPTIKGDLNGGAPILGEAALENLEPGMTVEREFFVENIGSGDAYYKLYFEGIEGGLADKLEVVISRKDTGAALYEGTLAELTREQTVSVDDPLAVSEKRFLKITVRIGEGAASSVAGTELTFSLSADFTQVKNNPDREFND